MRISPQWSFKVKSRLIVIDSTNVQYGQGVRCYNKANELVKTKFSLKGQQERSYRIRLPFMDRFSDQQSETEIWPLTTFNNIAEHLQANQLAYYCGSPFVFSSFPLQIKDMCLIILYFICCDPSLMNSWAMLNNDKLSCSPVWTAVHFIANANEVTRS